MLFLRLAPGNGIPSPFHKPAATHFGQLAKAHGLVKGNGFRRVIRCQFNLAYMAVSIQNGLQEQGTNAFALVLWMHQNILHKHDGISIAHGADDACKPFSFVGCQRSMEFSNPFRSASGQPV